MSVNYAINYLLMIEHKREEKVFTKDTFCVGVARLGSSESKIVAGTAEELLDVDFGEPLHSLIVPGKLHFVEEDALKMWHN
jgi:diphthine synthase